MEKDYKRFVDISESLPNHISRNLLTMPNNKAYRWRGCLFFGKLKDEPGPVVIFDKKAEGMFITEITSTSQVTWLKKHDYPKKLVSSVKRQINNHSPATIY